MRVALALALVLIVALAGAYLARREIAREVLVGWLEARGVKAKVDIKQLQLDGVVARLRIGSEDEPEFAVEQVEVTYALQGFWSGRPLGVDVASVRVVRPVVRARWRDGRLSLGALDGLIDELSKRPPQADTTTPLIEVEGARAFLDSPYGMVALKADARMVDGRLMSMRADLGPTTLRADDLVADISSGTLTVQTVDDRLDVNVALASKRVAAGDLQGRGLQIDLIGQAPYPDTKARRADGSIDLSIDVKADQLDANGVRAETLRAKGQFDGRVTGWVETLALSGPIRLALTAASANGADAKARNLQAGFAGNGRWSTEDWRVQGTGTGRARGAWSGLGAIANDDPSELAALKRAMSDFAVSAPNVAVAAEPKSIQVSLPSPVQVSAANGVRARISGRPGRAFYADGKGALALNLTGGGLPKLDLAVANYHVGGKGLDAAIEAHATGSFGPIEDGDVQTRGALVLADGGLTYSAKGCAPLAVARIAFGANDLRSLNANLCAARDPLFSIANGNWRFRGVLSGAAARAPFLEARVEEAKINLDANSRGGALRLNAQVSAARLLDEAEAKRFNPVTAVGDVALTGDKLRGEFDLTGAGGNGLAQATVHHDLGAGEGGLTIDTGDLEFMPGGLQPVTISPLASLVASPVTGHARFQGRIGWSDDEMTSGGELTVPSLDFKSPAGGVAGLSGDLIFTSLVPLVTAPNQTLTVQRIDSLAPLTHAALDFQLLGDVLKVTTGAVEIGGGRLELEPLKAPLDGSAFEGALKVENVQLSDLVERSPFADRVSLDARVTGRLPFVLGPDGVRFINGKLEAVQPGRLSIRREALSDVASAGGQTEVKEGAPPIAAPETNTVTEFAFQALENLAFDSLSAEVNSLPEGRLGVLFKVQGAHEPPKEQQLELGLTDLIDPDLLKRKLPLPSHTKVNLTLDTTLNLDQLLQDFVETQRAGSGPVQP